jgi:hypothetical protein
MQAADEAVPELLERLPAPIGNRRERLGPASSFGGRIVARRWGLDQFEGHFSEEDGDVEYGLLRE